MIYVFGAYELDVSRYELRRTGTPLRIEPKVFDLLAYLIQQHDHAVSKDELLKRLWPEQYVSEAALTYCIMGVRKAVGDNGRAQRVIKTVRGRGYRFIAPVQTRRSEIPTGKGLHEPATGVLPSVATAVASTPDGGRLSHRTPVSKAERRQVTVLVCRLRRALAHTDQDGLDELQEVLPHAHEVCTRIVRQFGEHIAQQLGDKLAVYFGYPRAHEDDARRAVHTGLEMLQGITRLNRSLRQESGLRLLVRVGIHTGSMVLGGMEHEAPDAQLLLGDTPTIATQLQDLATADMVVISPATRQRIAGYFVCQTLGAFVLDAGSQPVLVSRVLRATQAQNRFS